MFEQKQPLTTKWKQGPFFGWLYYESGGETESSKFPVEAKAKRQRERRRQRIEQNENELLSNL